jgi:two-component system sensor histidine kinase QseC
MTRLPRSLQGRLLVLVLGGVLLLWLAAALAAWQDTRHELDELLDSHLAQAAALLVAQQLHPEDEDHRSVDAPHLHRYATRSAFQVWHEGRLALRSANAPAAPMGQWRSGFQTVDLDGAPWRVFATRGRERDVQVYVGEQLDSRAEILRAALRSLLWPLLLALPLLALAVWWAVREGLAPLRGLSATLRQRSPQDLRPLAPQPGGGAPTEMQPLLDALNGLFERMAALLDSERRFTADAAHELRTPIAAIRAQAQVALGASEAPERDHALRQTLAGCDRATHLVEQMLTLARLEAAATTPDSTVDLAAVTRRVAAELAGAALARGQQLELQADAACPVRAGELLLQVLVRNLLDNALRYSPEGAQVRLLVQQAAGQAELVVEDSGPGLDEAQCQRLGERFFRVAGSGASGSGLGWSIVRRIAATQGAQVQVQASASLGGLRVQLRWPIGPGAVA